jgi:hypothetical protein
MTHHQCSGPVYHFRSCLGCCARFVVSARPSRSIQEGNLAYLVKYQGRTREEVLAQVEAMSQC